MKLIKLLWLGIPTIFLLTGCAATSPRTEKKAAIPPPAEVTGFKENSEPDGFREITWGTDLKTLTDMEYSRTDPSFGGIKTYTRKDDLLMLGPSKIEKIEYCFWQEKFCNVWLYTKGLENWDKLKTAFFEKFGAGFQANKYNENHLWFGDITKIRIEYNARTEQGTIVLLSSEAFKQMEKKHPRNLQGF
ncbi:MAG: hypothetical protein JW957_09255 [Candidatus Omnitrophica bacterium]|nr:hypothetical protein [Candidatus Omnitrophota bacterium]